MSDDNRAGDPLAQPVVRPLAWRYYASLHGGPFGEVEAADYAMMLQGMMVTPDEWEGRTLKAVGRPAHDPPTA